MISTVPQGPAQPHVVVVERKHAGGYTAAPNSRPTTAVSPMANAPQNATRKAPFVIDAPPAYPASPPKTSNAASEVRDETSATRAAGASSAVRMGMMAPAQKAAAEAKRGLHRLRAQHLGDAELVAHVCGERIVRHHLLGNLARQRQARVRG
jgi:hypothetical protein